MNKHLVLIAALLFPACSKMDSVNKVVTEIKVADVEVMDINRPPQFSLQIRSTDRSISDYLDTTEECSNWRNVEYGAIYEMEYTVTTKYYKSGKTSKTIALPNSCTFANYAVVKYRLDVK